MYIISNTVKSQSNTDYTLVISAMYMWHLKQSAIDRHMAFYIDSRFSCNPVDMFMGIIKLMC